MVQADLMTEDVLELRTVLCDRGGLQVSVSDKRGEKRIRRKTRSVVMNLDAFRSYKSNLRRGDRNVTRSFSLFLVQVIYQKAHLCKTGLCYPGKNMVDFPQGADKVADRCKRIARLSYDGCYIHFSACGCCTAAAAPTRMLIC